MLIFSIINPPVTVVHFFTINDPMLVPRSKLKSTLHSRLEFQLFLPQNLSQAATVTSPSRLPRALPPTAPPTRLELGPLAVSRPRDRCCVRGPPAGFVWDVAPD